MDVDILHVCTFFCMYKKIFQILSLIIPHFICPHVMAWLSSMFSTAPGMATEYLWLFCLLLHNGYVLHGCFFYKNNTIRVTGQQKYSYIKSQITQKKLFQIFTESAPIFRLSKKAKRNRKIGPFPPKQKMLYPSPKPKKIVLLQKKK